MLKKRKRGTTLIELIMAMLIMSAIAIPAASMIGGQIQGMVKSSAVTTAGNAARLVMEKLTNTPYSAITTGISLPGNSLVVGFYTVTWDVTETGSGAIARKDITVTVKRTGTSPVLVTLNTSLFNGATNGVVYGL